MSDASVPPVQGMQDIHDAYRWRTFILPLVLHLPHWMATSAAIHAWLPAAGLKRETYTCQASFDPSHKTRDHQQHISGPLQQGSGILLATQDATLLTAALTIGV